FLGYFFLAKQKEVTGCRAAPGLVMTKRIQNQQPQSAHCTDCPIPTTPNTCSKKAHPCHR
ncbi:hypothetical protein QN370_20300, partial [Actimicrobium sp. CCI2.3]|nr:hypothetical protein [Actimicrobium sp. CCI2.3]